VSSIVNGTDLNNTASNDYNLMVTGIVLCTDTQQPIENATVQLEDLLTKQVRTYNTNLDGAYFFILESDKSYQLSYVGSDQDDNVYKKISTVGKSDEILKTILQVSGCGDINNDSPFKVEEQTVTSDPNIGSSDMPKLTYKIQIGVFRQQLSNNSSFVRGAKYKITNERLPNGYIRYLTEDFYDLAKTYEKVDDLKQRGYDKSFIVPYYQGKRLPISPEKAKEQYNK